MMEAGERGRWKGGSGEGKWSCDACDASRRRTGAMDSGVPSKDPRRDSPLGVACEERMREMRCDTPIAI